MHHHKDVLFRVVQLEFRGNLSKDLVKHENKQETLVGNSKITLRKNRIFERCCFEFFCFSVSKEFFVGCPPPFPHNHLLSLPTCFSSRAREVQTCEQTQLESLPTS